MGRMFLVSSATMWPDRSQGRNARVFPVNSVRMFPDSSATMFPASSVRMFPSRSVRMFFARSVRMFPANSASRFQSRSVRPLSLPMESRKRAFSKTQTQSRNTTSVKTNHPQVSPPPNFTNVEDRNFPRLSSQLPTLFIENHIYFMVLIFFHSCKALQHKEIQNDKNNR